MSSYGRRPQREDKQEPTALAKFFNLFYFIGLAVAAFFIAGLALGEAERQDLLDLDGIIIPQINEPVPEVVIQVVLALIIFFILQTLVVLVLSLFQGGKKDLYNPERDQWDR